MGEEWKVYPKDTRLLISTHGRIRSVLTGYDIKPKHSGKYYRLSYDLLDINVHHVVAQTFIPNPELHKYVRHKNLDYHDNSIENLEWIPRSSGRKKKGDGSTESASIGTTVSDSFTVGNYSVVYVPVPSKWAVFFEDELVGLFETRDEAVEHC